MTLKPCPRCARPIEHTSRRCTTCGWTPEVLPEADTATAIPAGGQPSTPSEPAFPFVPLAAYKLVLLSLTTLGIYQLVWIYRMWARLKERAAADVSPFWRTFFAPFFAFDLFRRVSSAAAREHRPASWHPTTLGWGFLALSMAWRLPDPWWLVTFLNVAPLVPVLRTVNEINYARRQPEVEDRKLSAGNWVVLVVGSIVLWLAVIGTFLPESSGGA